MDKLHRAAKRLELLPRLIKPSLIELGNLILERAKLLGELVPQDKFDLNGLISHLESLLLEPRECVRSTVPSTSYDGLID
jgi:hypothetical protein